MQAAQPTTSQGTQGPPPTFLDDVLPIFMGKCGRCHSAGSAFLSNWSDYQTAFRDRAEIRRRIWDSWQGTYFKQPMPTGNSPEADAITPEERETIRQWVERGALRGVISQSFGARSKAEQLEHGKRLFGTICSACHQPTGQGIPNRFPPLAGSDFLNADKDRAIRVVIHGLQGEVVVNGRHFNNSMPSFPLSDQDIADALTFVYNSFGNSGKAVGPDEVRRLRDGKGPMDFSGNHSAAIRMPDQKSPWE